MVYPADFENKIGFDSVRNMISQKCTSSMGKEEVNNMSFSSDYDVIIRNLKSTEEMMEILNTSLPLPLDNISDVIPSLSEIKAASGYMSAQKLMKLLQMLETIERVNRFFNEKRDDSENLRFPVLASEYGSLMTFPGIVSEINRCVNKYGEVKDSASPALQELRTEIRREQGSMQRAMRRVIDRAVSQGIVDKDTTASIRDGRLVLPVSAGNKRGITGIVHDESATGKTVFIEPLEVVEASNRLRELEIEEKREIVKILIAVADVIRPYAEAVKESCQALGVLDFVRAKAYFAIDMDGCVPHIEDKEELEWYHALHPGLVSSLRSQGRQAVPLDITLNEKQRILIISGPNAGGKSVCLKTVATVQYMMQCGIPPTLYDNSHMGVFDRIFIDIGDEQSFENDLSTYSSHLKNMKYFLLNANASTLFLADEMGSGTEPQIGGAMAQAILHFLGETGCFGVVTTHYQNLKSFGDSEPGFINGAMLYDRQHLKPTFQLSMGSPGSSFALDIAGKIGLPKKVIEEAKNIVGSDMVNLDKYLSEITRDRRYWANKRLSIKEKEHKLENLVDDYQSGVDSVRMERSKIIKEAKKEAKEILAEANAKIERTILEIRNAQAEKEKTKNLRRELEEYKREVEKEDKAALENIPGLKKVKSNRNRKTTQPVKKEAVKDTGFAVGDYVKMDGGGVTGRILSISGNKAEVAFGALRTQVNVSKLKASQKPKESISTQVSTVTRETAESSRQRQLNFSTEIDVRGMRADEAIQAVTYFMDDVVQFNASRVRILHGTGHGILKTLIREQLRANPNVVTFHDEDVRFGGAGITVVELD